VIENEIFKPKGDEDYTVNYVSANLAPNADDEHKPWSSIDKALRDQVDAIMVFRLSFTASDLELFPKLKWSVQDNRKFPAF
jgi:C-terminal binding protein